MTTLTKNNDKLEHDELEHDKLSLHGMNLTSKEKPKGTKFACELAGHRPGIMSEFGGIAGWLAQPRQGAAVQTKEAAQVADVEARGLASQTAAEAPKPRF